MERKNPSRYAIGKGAQAESQPGSKGRVLRNRRGILKKAEMDRAEHAALIRTQEQYLRKITERTSFTSDLICRMHRDWLGSIYEWAGEYRAVNLSKGDFSWPPAGRVAQNMDRFETGTLARCTPCQAGTVESVSGQLAEVHAELLLIHPFREGNGRLARWLADLMAMQAGLAPPDHGFTGRGSRGRKERYLDAVLDGYGANYEPLTKFFREALERSLADLA